MPINYVVPGSGAGVVTFGDTHASTVDPRFTVKALMVNGVHVKDTYVVFFFDNPVGTGYKLATVEGPDPVAAIDRAITKRALAIID